MKYPPEFAKVEVTVSISPDKWREAEKQGYTSVDIQKRIEKAIERLTVDSVGDAPILGLEARVIKFY